MRSSPLCKIGPGLMLCMALAAWLTALLFGDGDRVVSAATVFGLGVAAARLAQEARFHFISSLKFFKKFLKNLFHFLAFSMKRLP